MKRFFNLLIAIVCFALVINGIVSGRIGGLQKSGAGGMAIQETDPGYFWLWIGQKSHNKRMQSDPAKLGR
ncbi:MAG: hypothetical protein OER04_19250 [Cyclobacteriaceae bacterium]|nr:hypothetical protein [Cyclobacteriaceae bacterium]